MIRYLIDPKLALQLVLSEDFDLETEIVPLEKSLHKILAEDLLADFDLPNFHKSLFDGFAYNSQSKETSFNLISEIRAGDEHKITGNFSINDCIKIMTGALVPDFFDKVIKIEDTKISGNKVDFILKPEDSNICHKGSYLKKGDLVIKKATLINPAVIANFSMFGFDKVKVYKTPKVCVITSGDELLSQGEKLEDGKIFDSNLPMLYSQLKLLGIDEIKLIKAKDDYSQISDYFKNSLANFDIIIFSGGASMGDYDYIPKVMEDSGVEFIFKKMLFKPGKPTYFAKKDKKYIFSLPGNTVSSYTVFEFMIKPFIYKYMGFDYKRKEYYLNLAEEISRREIERYELIPVMVKDNKMFSLNLLNSGHLSKMSYLDGFVEMNINQKILKKDSIQKLIIL